MEDERIIALLFARSEEGLCALKEKYGSLCRAIAHGILGDARDAEECVADAYWGVWRAIPPARPSPLGAYVAKVARNLALKRRRDVSAKKRSVRFECALANCRGRFLRPETWSRRSKHGNWRRYSLLLCAPSRPKTARCSWAGTGFFKAVGRSVSAWG